VVDGVGRALLAFLVLDLEILGHVAASSPRKATKRGSKAPTYSRSASGVSRSGSTVKLFFNLRSMKTGLAPLSSGDVKHIANDLRVNPEPVTEMETRLAGREMAFEPEQEDEDGYAPVHYLADEASEPTRVLEAEQSRRAGWRRRMPRASTTSPPNSTSPPSASGRSRRRRWRKCARRTARSPDRRTARPAFFVLDCRA